MFWKRKKPELEEFQKFPDALTLWMACSVRNIGPIQLKKHYAAYVLRAGKLTENGQELLIRVAVLEDPHLDINVMISSTQFRNKNAAIQQGDMVTWVPFEHQPGGRVMYNSTDPRADFLAIVSAKIDIGMNIKTGGLKMVESFMLA